MKQNGKSGGNSARTAVLILCGAVLAAAVGFAVHAGVTSGADNEIWSYGPQVQAVMEKYIALRERLRPYIKDQMELIHTKGTPIMRPLFFDFREDSASWDVDDQYMFGPDIMVCPVMDAGVESRSVYLPAGASWTDAWTGKVYEGGQTIEAAAPIDVIPLFLKDGAKLPITE